MSWHTGPVLTADDVLNARFQATKFRVGYVQDEVDDFLDRVVYTLRTREGGPVGRAVLVPVTAAEAAQVSFGETTFREGYDRAEVDALLDRVSVALGGSAHRAGPRAQQGAAGAIVEEPRGLFGRWRSR